MTPTVHVRCFSTCRPPCTERARRKVPPADITSQCESIPTRSKSRPSRSTPNMAHRRRPARPRGAGAAHPRLPDADDRKQSLRRLLSGSGRPRSSAEAIEPRVGVGQRKAPPERGKWPNDAETVACAAFAVAPFVGFRSVTQTVAATQRRISCSTGPMRPSFVPLPQGDADAVGCARCPGRSPLAGKGRRSPGASR